VRDLTRPGEGVAWTQAFSADGRTLAAGVGSEVRLFDVPSGEERRRHEGHAGRVLSLAFHPRGIPLISGATDRTARRWDPDTGSWTALACGERAVADFAFSPDGAELAGAGSDGAVLLWDAAKLDATAAPRVLGRHAAAVWSVDYDPANGILASGSEDGEVRLWRTDTGEVLATLRAQPRLRHLSFTHDGSRLAAASFALPSTTWDLGAIRALLAELGLDWDPRR
jgi:WD40 repeat protein